MELMDRLNRRISRVNRTPASGALKMPATAPAAPHPSKSVIPRYDKPMYRPRLEPMAAPVYTMGASAPTDPPKPIVRALVTNEDTVLCFLILDSFLETAWSTFVTPWPMLSLTI